MIDRRKYLHRIVAAGSTGLLITVAGCTSNNSGGGNSGSGAATTNGGPTTGGAATTGGETTATGGSKPTVHVTSNDEYGNILVDANGLSLYLFEKDQHGKSTCSGACADVWPPLTIKGKPVKGNSVTAALGTTTRKEGPTQVTAADHPLYYYEPDKKPGQTNGQGINGFGAEWYLLAPDGSKIEKGEEKGTKTTSGGDTGGNGGGGGYGNNGGSY